MPAKDRAGASASKHLRRATRKWLQSAQATNTSASPPRAAAEKHFSPSAVAKRNTPHPPALSCCTIPELTAVSRHNNSTAQTQMSLACNLQAKNDAERPSRGQTAAPRGQPGNGNGGSKFPNSQHRAWAKHSSAGRGHVPLLCLLHILSMSPTAAPCCSGALRKPCRAPN